ncbi:MAG: hypothetical protein ACRDIC_11135 [bacterium]
MTPDEAPGRNLVTWNHALAWGGMTMLYAATALTFFVAPIWGRFGDVLLGTSLFPHDPVANAGILEWVYRSLWSPSLTIFNWTAGFPLDNTLAGTENLLAWQLLYTPLRAMGVGIAAAYNVLIVTSFIISGIGGALLAQRFGASRYGATVAGFIFAFVPFHLNHVIHLQTMGIFWSPFALLFLDRYLAGRAVKDATGLALAFALTALSAIYFTVFLLLVLLTYVVVSFAFGRHRFDWRTLTGLAATGLATGVVLLPLGLPYLRWAAEHGYYHPVDVLVRFSVDLVGLVKVPGWVAAWSGTWLARKVNWRDGLSWNAAFPGMTATALGIFYLFSRSQSLEERRIKWILFFLSVFALLLSLGPVLKLRPGLAVEWVPMPGSLFARFSAIRWPARILLYTYLFGGVLAGLGASMFTQRLTPRARALAALPILLLLMLEYWPARWYAGNSVTVPPPLALSDAYPFLANEADRGGVVELPSADETGYRTPMMHRYTYASAGHFRRVVAVFGSVQLTLPRSLQDAADRLPDPSARDQLMAHGVTRLVVHQTLMPPKTAARITQSLRAAGYPVLHEGKEAVVFALTHAAR